MAPTTLPVRPGHPDTSHEAAATAAERAPVIRDVVLRLMQEHGPMTHDEVIAEYRSLLLAEPDTPRASDSGIRTRLSELVRRGLVTSDETKGFSNFGNSATRWVAVEASNKS